MPIDLLVLGFVAAGFVAIVLRFAPRDARGKRRLPQAVDDSVGMFTLRRLLGRPTGLPDEEPEVFAVVPTPREVAYRIGAAGASRPSVRARPTLAIDDIAPQVRPTAPAATDLIRARTRWNPALGAQRRLAAALVALLVIAVVIAVVAASADARGGVLAATGAPAGRPVAALECSADGRTVTCTAAHSVRADTYVFLFEGGSRVSGPASVAEHTFEAPGTYLVTLTVTDGVGQSSTDSAIIVVS
ncbi:MAG TPA: PKD domain-containing protein [Candidatus Limnocylindrales bacterium]|nr:PKD domain-containing protein [Candidatus Limnocylindrales bacterium]